MNAVRRRLFFRICSCDSPGSQTESRRLLWLTSASLPNDLTNHGRRWLSVKVPIAFLVTFNLLCVLFVHAAFPLTKGQWTTLPYGMPINPIHCSVLHTGKVLIVAGSENEPDNPDPPRAAVWDLGTGTIVVQNLLWDVFCNGMAALPDGRFLIVGGTEQYDPFHGEPRATIFDPTTEKFAQVESMAHGRWYATVTALDDGRLMAFSGLDEFGDTNKTVEFYKVGSGWSIEYVAPWTPLLYPRLHLLPDGTVFYSEEGPDSHLFHVSSESWTLDVAHTVYPDSRTYGSSVLLPLRPEEIGRASCRE